MRRLTEQGQDLMVAGPPRGRAPSPRPAGGSGARWCGASTGWRSKLADLETLYDVVHDEVEDAALDVAAALRSVRRGNGMLGRVRRLLVAGRS